jgi:hypothetical protein
VHTFAYFGGPARQTVSDNLQAGITKACFDEPTVNRTYADLARHYGTAIVPARPYKPRDKAKVERSGSRSSDGGSWLGCGTGGSSRWPITITGMRTKVVRHRRYLAFRLAGLAELRRCSRISRCRRPVVRTTRPRMTSAASGDARGDDSRGAPRCD